MDASASPANVLYIRLLPVYSPLYIVLAFLLAFVGAWTSMELLLRRTGRSGLLNVCLLVGGGVAFGSTTFGMHILGNQALSLRYPANLNGPQPPVVLSHAVGFTLLSLAVSICSMILAFSFIGLRIDSHWWPSRNFKAGRAMDQKGEAVDVELELEEATGKAALRRQGRRGAVGDMAGVMSSASLCGSAARPSPAKRKDCYDEDSDDSEEEDDNEGEFGTSPARLSGRGAARILGAGVVCGGGIVSMHYIGQLSIDSVSRVTNAPYLIVLSIAVAICAVSLGLWLLFVVLRPKLKHRWYKRAGVAALLALAVSVMHWVALLGTHYYVIEGAARRVGSAKKARNLIIAIVCIVVPLCCFTLLIIGFVAQQRVLRQNAARHRLIVAVALFDEQGHLLIQHEDGMLPSAEISPNPSHSSISSSLLAFFGIRRTGLHTSTKKLSRADPVFIAFLRASWLWQSSTETRSIGTRELLETPKGLSRATDYLDSRRSSGSESPGMAAAAFESRRTAMLGFYEASLDLSGRLAGSQEDGRISTTHVNGVLFDGILKTQVCFAHLLSEHH